MPNCSVCKTNKASFVCNGCTHTYCSSVCADVAWYKQGHYVACGTRIVVHNLSDKQVYDRLYATSVLELQKLSEEKQTKRYVELSTDSLFMDQYAQQHPAEEWVDAVKVWTTSQPTNWAALRKWLPLLLRYHYDDWHDDEEDADEVDLLALAAYDGAQDVFELLLRDERFPPTTRALRSAAQMGRMSMVTTMLEDTQVDWSDDMENVDTVPTVFEAAAAYGRTDVVRALLADGRLSPYARGNSALLLACKRGHADVVNALLDDEGVHDIFERDYDYAQTNALMLELAIEGGHEAVVERLLKEPIIIEMFPANTDALDVAVKKGMTEIVKHLLQVPTLDPASVHNSAMKIACRQNLVPIVSLLMRFYPKTSPFVGGVNSAFSSALSALSVNVIRFLGMQMRDIAISELGIDVIGRVLSSVKRDDAATTELITFLIRGLSVVATEMHLSDAIEQKNQAAAIALLANSPHLHSPFLLVITIEQAQAAGLDELVKAVQSIQRTLDVEVEETSRKQRRLVQSKV